MRVWAKQCSRDVTTSMSLDSQTFTFPVHACPKPSIQAKSPPTIPIFQTDSFRPQSWNILTRLRTSREATSQSAARSWLQLTLQRTKSSAQFASLTAVGVDRALAESKRAAADLARLAHHQQHRQSIMQRLPNLRRRVSDRQRSRPEVDVPLRVAQRRCEGPPRPHSSEAAGVAADQHRREAPVKRTLFN